MLEKARRLKDRWAAGDVTYGAWVAIGSPMVAEVMAYAGFDWLFIDTEHTAIDLQDLQSMLIAIDKSETVPIVRIPSADPVTIKRVLDIGAAGILVPNVLDEEGVRQVVAATRYPPQGVRGFGPWRASAYFTNTPAYVASANRDHIVIVQLEDIKAMSQLDAMLEVDGLDAICTGPADMAGSMGCFGKADDPKVLAALDQIFASARKKGKPSAHGLIASIEQCEELIAKGVQIIPIAADVAQLRSESAAKIAQYKKLLPHTRPKV